MKTLHLVIFTITGIGFMVGLGVHFIVNHAISEDNQNGDNFMESMHGNSSINEMEIIGLRQNYTVGEPINASVTYTGYLNVEPSLEILDPYGEIVWNNCCNYTQTPPLSFGTHTIKALQPAFVNGLLELRRPVFNSSGNYAMIVSLDNKTLQQTFNVLDNTNMTYPTTNPDEPVYHDHPNPPQYSIVNATFGVPVKDGTLSSNMVGFKVSLPTYLPDGYEVKLIKVEKGLPLVTVFASKYPLTDKTTSTQFFWLDKGILITYSIVNERALENSKWTLFTPQANKVTIGGYPAVVENIQKLDFHGHPYDMWADLVMLKGNVDIGVRGFLSEDDLVKITTSMLEN